MEDAYKSKLLNNWEDVFRQGLLTFWLYIVLSEQEMDVGNIKKQIEHLTNSSYSAAEQTLYRVLRKQYDLELVDYREVPSVNGPKKKLYSLSNFGRQLLKDFAERNISLFLQPKVKKLIKGGRK